MLPGSTSSKESGFVMRIVSPFLEIFVGKGNVTHHMVRKLAHFTEYFVLGVELSSLFAIKKLHTDVPGRVPMWLLIFLIGLSVASVDESIQIFSNERGPSITDVLLDFSGVVCAFVIVKLISIIISWFSRNSHV